MEEQALSKEKDAASKARLSEVRRALAALKDELAPLAMRYGQERARLEDVRRLQAKKEGLAQRLAAAQARRRRCCCCFYPLLAPAAADLACGGRSLAGRAGG